eukprot:1744943-Pleurochrysis_carterae.AAC.1
MDGVRRRVAAEPLKTEESPVTRASLVSKACVIFGIECWCHPLHQMLGSCVILRHLRTDVHKVLRDLWAVSIPRVFILYVILPRLFDGSDGRLSMGSLAYPMCTLSTIHCRYLVLVFTMRRSSQMATRHQDPVCPGARKTRCTGSSGSLCMPEARISAITIRLFASAVVGGCPRWQHLH